jgi:aminoglycoside 3-N-acetyltransferase
VGIAPSTGDLLLVHSDLSCLAEFGWIGAAERLLDAILTLIGTEGTLLAPTFTYSFCRGAPYHHEKTPGEVGLFGNYLLARSDSFRSLHPIFSCAAIGARAEELCSDLSHSAFGVGSIFSRLISNRGKVLFFNTSFQACTFVHYSEQRIGVDYRYSKEFTGQLLRAGKRIESAWEYYVRDLDREVTTDLSRLEERLREAGELRSGSLLGSSTLLVEAAAIDREIERGFQLDPYFLLRSPPRNSHANSHSINEEQRATPPRDS